MNTTIEYDPFPVPFRVLFLLCLGIWAWGHNVYLLRRVGVYPSTLLLSPGERTIRSRKIFEIAGVLSVMTFIGQMLFAITGSDVVITLTYTTLFLIVVNPFNGVCRRERMRFLRYRNPRSAEGE
jgi:hypothetical protein